MADQDRKTFQVLWHMADLSGYSTAVVDKIFWMAASGKWDKTLDKEPDEGNRKEQQLHRKQRFSNLLDKLLKDA